MNLTEFVAALDRGERPPVLVHPHPVLAEPAVPVGPHPWQGKSPGRVVSYMQEIAKARGAAGLAAPQVGLGLRLVVTGERRRRLVLVDPEVLDRSTDAFDSIEGCLSLPGRRWRVTRSVWVTVRWVGLDGAYRHDKFTWNDAAVVQHELDHLDGVTLADHPFAEELVRDAEMRKLVEDKK